MRIATIVTGPAVRDFKTLLFTIRQWHPDASLYVATDSATLPTLKTLGSFHTQCILDAYTGMTRKDMEAQLGRKYPTLWHDFMMEKAQVLAWAMHGSAEGAWFLDADLCLLAPLPPVEGDLMVSPHMIRPVDERKFGRYNGGFLWVRNPALLDVWKRATYGSRFYEQAALEDVWAAADPSKRSEFPIQDNFGWWRFLQSTEPPPVIQSRLGFNRTLTGCGLTYDGHVLRSLHTHWEEASEFNQWIRSKLEFLARSHAPAKALLGHLTRLHEWKPKSK